MDNTDQLEQLIFTNSKLTQISERLVKANEQAMELIKSSLQKQEELLAHCGKVYNYLDSKGNKTWEEQESMDILYQLITQTQKKK